MQAEQRLKGASIVAVQAVAIAMTGILSKFVQQKGVPAFQLLAMQALIATVILLPWFYRFRKVPSLDRGELVVLILRAIFSLGCVGAFFYSLEGVPLTTALLLFNSGPLFVPFVAWAWGGRPVSLEMMIYITLGFLGIFLILDPELHEINHYYVIALCSGVLSSFVAVSTRKILLKNRLELSVFIVLVGNVLFFSLFAIPSITSFSFSLIPFIIGAGITWAIVQICFLGFKFTRVPILAPLLFFSVVVSGVFDWLVFGQVVDGETITGIIFVILASVLVLTHD